MSFYSQSWIKATRKQHCCWWCGKRIEIGSPASYAAGMGMDDFWSGHAHPECQAAIDSMPYDGEGFEMHEHARGRQDDDFQAPPQFSTDYRGPSFPKPTPSCP